MICGTQLGLGKQSSPKTVLTVVECIVHDFIGRKNHRTQLLMRILSDNDKHKSLFSAYDELTTNRDKTLPYQFPAQNYKRFEDRAIAN